MATNFVEIARENRVKALNGLKDHRNEFEPMPGYSVYRKEASRRIQGIFISSRGTGAMGQLAAAC